ncbi:MAG: VCBS repeat-containing protein [Nitrospirae bacterium]|nr:VCBS repeat-containing protein [Nitrospirota bacterium]
MLKISVYRPFIVLLSAVLLTSCAAQKEKPMISTPSGKEITVENNTIPDRKEEVRSEEKENKKPAQPSSIHCEENTDTNFNISGMKVLPFIKTAFFDMNGDGLTDLIAGGKNGLLYLYQNSGDPQIRYWKPVEEYFSGVNAGAFSAPSIGDIDGDGKAEIVIGTGGFSSDSGRILIFKNTGPAESPRWRRTDGTEIKIGNDAAVTIVDYNFDGAPDIIAGNSEGEISFFKNISTGRDVRFARDKSPLNKQSFDKYAVPAAIKLKDKIVLAIGTSMGKLYMFELEKDGKKVSPKNVKINLYAKRFLSPAFTNLLNKSRFDLVISDGDGIISYYENRKNDFSAWEKIPELFNNRIFAGPACAPTVCSIGSRLYMVVGNMDGRLKLYEYRNGPGGLPWVEKKGYLDDIKVSGFSRGVLARWEGRDILITGESGGGIKAFVNTGPEETPSWREEKKFFKGVRKNYHSTPAVFDLDNDGRLELITGADDGKIYTYKVKEIINGLPVWEAITGLFDNIQVKGFSTPSVIRVKDILYLFVGQEDGKIRTYTVELPDVGKSRIDLNKLVFMEKNFLNEIRMQSHSSPYLIINNGVIEMISGDYDGNIRHFNCIHG